MYLEEYFDYNMIGEPSRSDESPNEKPAEATADTCDAESASATGNGNGDDANPAESRADAEPETPGKSDSAPGNGSTAENPKVADGVSAERMEGIKFLSPTEIAATEVDEDKKLVGDWHINRGQEQVLGGAPGSAKSTLTMTLAINGALGMDWMGLSIPRPFRTMILQTENSTRRMKTLFHALACREEVDEKIRISAPPGRGSRRNIESFRDSIRRDFDAFGPDLLIVDPLNMIMTGADARAWEEAKDFIFSCIPDGQDPAIFIAHHTSKSKGAARRGYDSLFGSHRIAADVACIFQVEKLPDDGRGGLIIEFANTKNKEGPECPTSWWRVTGLGAERVDRQASPRRKVGRPPQATASDIIDIIVDFPDGMTKEDLVKAAVAKTGMKESTVRSNLYPSGKWGKCLEHKGGTLQLPKFDDPE